MASGRIGQVVRGLSAGADDALSDAQLLERFIVRREQDAFEALLRRHGPLVFGVCRRILHNESDAEDAFQATFLVLARKAATLQRRELLSNWLYGVAYRTALRARSLSARRLAREKEMARPEAVRGEPANDRLDRLDQEVSRLPDQYRMPIVLCELQGKSYKEAARLLGWPEGTLAGRLSRARALLARRLGRGGATLSGAALTAALGRSAEAAVPARLGAMTAQAAVAGGREIAAGLISARVAALVEATMKTFLLDRLRVVLALMRLLALAGAGVLAASRPSAREPRPGEEKAVRQEAPRGGEPAPRTDRHGDPLPQGAVARLGTWRMRHRGPVSCLVLSPEGKQLVSGGSADHLVRIWDAATGRELRHSPAGVGGSTGLAISPDGKQIVSAGDIEGLRVLDAKTGRLLRRIGDQTPRAVAFSPDGMLLASGGFDGFVRLWDSAGKEVRQFKGHTGEVSEVRFALGGKVLASLGHDKTVRLWDSASGRELHRLVVSRDPVYGLAVSPDGKTLATGGLDRTIRLWDVTTGKQTRAWEGSVVSVSSVAFSPDGRTLASGNLNGGLRLWDPATGKLVREVKGLDTSNINSTGQVRFFPDGKTLACVYDCVIRLFDTATLKERWPDIARQQGISSIAFSRDGKSIVTGHGDINYQSVPGVARLWETATSKEIREFSGPTGPVFGIALTPDGKTVIATGWEPGTWLWDAASGKERRRLVNDKGLAWRKLALSPDGKRLVVQNATGMADLWDLERGKLVHQLLSSGVSAQSFSPDGRVLALGVGDNTIGLYDLATGKLQHQITGRPVRVGGFTLTPLPSVHIVAFSPDGRTLASLGASNIVRLWDAKSRKELHWLMGHKDYADSAAFSPDGKMLATGDSNGTVRLWEVATGKERRRFVGHEDRVAALAFSPDGKVLASASLDTTALLWDVTGGATQNEDGK